MAAGLRSVEAELEEDAVLRMPAWQVLWRVTLRRGAAAIVVAAVWVAMVAAAEISVTDLFQVRTFAEEVYTQAALGAFDFSAAADGTISVLSLWYGVALSALLAVGALAFGRRFFDDLVHAPEQRPWIWRLGRRAGPRLWPCGCACSSWPACRWRIWSTRREFAWQRPKPAGCEAGRPQK